MNVFESRESYESCSQLKKATVNFNSDFTQFEMNSMFQVFIKGVHCEVSTLDHVSNFLMNTFVPILLYLSDNKQLKARGMRGWSNRENRCEHLVMQKYAKPR